MTTRTTYCKKILCEVTQYLAKIYDRDNPEGLKFSDN